MLIIDSHLDLSWSALNWNRDLTLPVSEIRRAEAGLKDFHRGKNTVSFPEMRRGEVAVCLATVLARGSGLAEPLLDYRNRDLAWAMAQGQLAYYRRMEALGHLRQLHDWPALDAHIQGWKHPRAAPPTLGYILSMEGADPILSPAQVADWWRDGLRVVGPAHYGVSAYAHGTGSPGGLTAQGPDLLRAMSEVGMVLDVTHLADESFWQAVEHFSGPVLASHHNCRALVPGDRQLSDDQIRYLIERKSVIGAAFDSWMLYPGYVSEHTDNTLVSLERVVDHIDHVCQLAGNARHSALGTDLDGGFGTEQSPREINTVADLQKIPALLRNRGYAEPDVEGILHGNWLRFFQDAWKHPTS